MKRAVLLLSMLLTLSKTQNISAYWNGNGDRVYKADGDYVIEVVTGVCLDEKGNGIVVYDTFGEVDPEYNYISYAGLDVPVGGVVQTIYFYDGTKEVEDDILFRDDYVVEVLK